MNENCLAGMACPKCGSEGPFRITVTMIVQFVDDGSDYLNDKDGDQEWDDSSYCMCVSCRFEGKVSDFRDGFAKLLIDRLLPNIQENLDELVITSKEGEASDINNGGPEEQVRYLLGQYGASGILEALRGLLADEEEP